MIDETFLRLQHSESIVSTAASQILAAFIVSGQLTEENEDELINKSLKMAIKLAHKADTLVESDEEHKI